MTIFELSFFYLFSVPNTNKSIEGNINDIADYLYDNIINLESVSNDVNYNDGNGNGNSNGNSNGDVDNNSNENMEFPSIGIISEIYDPKISNLIVLNNLTSIYGIKANQQRIDRKLSNLTGFGLGGLLLTFLLLFIVYTISSANRKFVTIKYKRIFTSSFILLSIIMTYQIFFYTNVLLKYKYTSNKELLKYTNEKINEKFNVKNSNPNSDSNSNGFKNFSNEVKL
jgi:hypothetical protein